MKKFTMTAMFALFLFDATGQILSGAGQILSGTVNSIANPTKKIVSETARWAGHYEYVEEGNDASGMSVTG